LSEQEEFGWEHGAERIYLVWCCGAYEGECGGWGKEFGECCVRDILLMLLLLLSGLGRLVQGLEEVLDEGVGVGGTVKRGSCGVSLPSAGIVANIWLGPASFELSATCHSFIQSSLSS